MMSHFQNRSPEPWRVGMLAADRRTVLKGLLGAAGLLATGPLLAACGGSTPAASSGGTGAITLGSSGSEPTAKKAYQALIDAFAKTGGGTITPNIVDNNTFQKTINSYLQGTPDDVFTWYAGYRMQTFAKKGLLHPIDAIWPAIEGNFTAATKSLCLGEDGKPYFVPIYNYPTAVFYRKSVFAQHGYQAPATFDELVSLAGRMKTDGLSPFAHGIGSGDGWTLLNTFDYLNLRTNGYQFHIDLMGGKTSWTDPKVTAVLDQWSRVIPFYQQGGAGRKWQDAQQALVDKKAGMAVAGMFVATSFTGADIDDLDFFPFPVVDPAHGLDSVEAPTDGFLLSKSPKNLDGALKLMQFIGTAAAAEAYQSGDQSNLAVVTNSDTSKYNALQTKAAALIASSKNMSQFGDRDSDPGFMSDVVIPAFSNFVSNPGQAQPTLQSIESQKSRYFSA
jgi:multiple sugar transport system substrate-binding protein